MNAKQWYQRSTWGQTKETAMAYLTTRRTLASLLRRALSSSSSPSSRLTSCSRFALSILNQQPRSQLVPNSLTVPTRFKTSTPDCGRRPSKEALLLHGCDYQHWLIVMDFPTDPKPSEEEMVDSYVKTLASVLGSEEEARKKIYSVRTSTYTGFGALISEELSSKLKGLPGVLWVLPDSYLDVQNKDYGGDLYVDGKVTHRPLFTPIESPTKKRRLRARKTKDENPSAGTEK